MKNVCNKNAMRLGTWWGNFVGLGAWLGILCLIMGHVSAATMAYYRFEGSTAGGSSAPWVSDSSGNGYTLIGSNGAISQVSSVLNPVPVNSLSNLSAASFSGSNFYTNPVSGVLSQMSSFTVEAFVNWQGPYSAGTTGVIAGQWDTTGYLYSYFFGVDANGHPTLGVNPGGTSSSTTFSSSQTLTVGVNYYMAVTFDPADSAGGIKFYLLDLSNDQNNLQLQVMANSLTSLRPPTARLVIGCSAFSGANSYLDGTLDEVRISNVPLDRSGLLISGPSFREFSGVNGSGTSNTLFSQALSYNRSDFFWGSVEPTQGNWQQSVLTSLGSQILTYHAENVNYLPIFDYMNQWAADMTPRQWSSTDGTTMNTLVPSGSNMLLSTYTLQGNGTYSLTSTYTTTAVDISHFPPASTSTWTNYVSKTATFLAAPPYNVRYFQIWNEAYYTSGFWIGSMADYFNKIHTPAAAAIHAAGGKVVYGGWPDVAPITELISDLDAYNAWGTIDVLDFHYLAPSTYATLRAAADSRGYTNIAIWQTETGYTGYIQFVLDEYSRLLYWGLSNHWTSTDMYKALYYITSQMVASGSSTTLPIAVKDPAGRPRLSPSSSRRCRKWLLLFLQRNYLVAIFGHLSHFVIWTRTSFFTFAASLWGICEKLWQPREPAGLMLK
jgi:hypothetical protein